MKKHIDVSKRISIGEFDNTKPGHKIVLSGWVQEIRDLSKLFFLIIRDRDGLAQIIVDKDFPNIDDLKEITKESVIVVEGVVQEAKSTDFSKELKMNDYEILSPAEAQLPIEFMNDGINTGTDKRFDYRWIDLRNPKNMLIFRINSDFQKFCREFFDEEGMIEIHTPKLIGSPSESGSEVFEIPYFKKKAYLAQSPQFYKQMAVSAGMEKVFEVAPVFRAEKSHTSRHNTEFTGLDIEMAWVNSVEDVMQFEERMIVDVMKKIKEKYGEEVKKIFGVKIEVPETPFPRITMEEARNIIKIHSGKKVLKNDDLDTEGEKIVGDVMKSKKKHDFVFVTEFPWAVRPFYHMKNEEETTRSYDLLYKGIEITTGAQREHRYDKLLKQAEEKGLGIKSLQFYLNFFRWGCPPHGGFGFGPARFMMGLLDLPHIRESTLLPRDTERLYP